MNTLTLFNKQVSISFNSLGNVILAYHYVLASLLYFLLLFVIPNNVAVCVSERLMYVIRIEGVMYTFGFIPLSAHIWLISGRTLTRSFMSPGFILYKYISYL